MPVRRTRTALVLTAAAATLLPLTACAGGTQDATGTKDDAKAAPGFPYTVENCGVRTTFTKPPARALAMNQHATEILLELGLASSVTGSAYLDDKVLPKYEKDYAKIPVVAKEYPSKEKLLAANPDFVYGGYASAFDPKQGRGREDLKKSGIDSRLNIEYCTEGSSAVDDIYREVTEVGRTFGVGARADSWVAAAKKTVDDTAAALKGVEPVSVFAYDSGDKTASTAGGKGIANEMITRAGGTNVMADVPKPFADASWEQVVTRKPDVIMIIDYGSTTVEQKKKRLLDDPALKDVPAIKNKKFAVMPLSELVVGVRAPAAIERLAHQLHPELKK
ncbi:ABC transporter substrate-binding protein [Streptomyces candidus]|uniref:Iron complex transport system substrate-binding protein n=1 Tax=Streptomyces candidus TaxID=67283 RepID=A0A7X0HFV8_9ACTN|nr:ABC transporter substrate-binding protein [Streptomyces candidus]MBB6436907.1 iron complex transport system substrate-binding protein [Streptomyces candidus]GHH32203.1 lipoprotein [Streptomyces candidus]